MGCAGTNGTFAGTPISTGSSQIFGVNTSCAVAFGYSTAELNTEQQTTYRLDYNLGSSTKLSAKAPAGIQATGASPVNPLYNTVSVQPSDQEQLNIATVITPAVVNTLQASVLWYTAIFGVADFAKTSTLMPESIGISDGGANSAGFASVGSGGYPNGRNVGHIQLSDDLSWSRGRHTLKAGFASRYDQYTYTSIASNIIVGSYSLGDLSDFAYGQLGHTVVNGVPDTFSSFSQKYTPYQAFHFVFPATGFYLSDDWNVTKDLKLNLGLRGEINNNPPAKRTASRRPSHRHSRQWGSPECRSLPPRFPRARLTTLRSAQDTPSFMTHRVWYGNPVSALPIRRSV